MIETNRSEGTDNNTRIIQKKYDLSQNDVVEWHEDRDGRIWIPFRKKVTIDEMTGCMKTDEKIDSVELVREYVYR